MKPWVQKECQLKNAVSVCHSKALSGSGSKGKPPDGFHMLWVSALSFAAMAPRIRLGLSKPLPTICETHEEAVEDSTNSQKGSGSTAASPDTHSSDDYIQSICHLARPTFPGLPESSSKVQGRRILKSSEDMSWSPALGGMQQETPERKLSSFISNVVPLGKVMSAEADFWAREDPLAQIYTCAGKLCSTKASSYGSSTSYSRYFSTPNNELHPPATKGKATENPSFPGVFSFPRLPSPRPAQKDAVCSGGKNLRRDEGAVLGNNQRQKGHSTSLSTSEEPPAGRGTPAWHSSVGRQGSLSSTAGTDGKEGRGTSHCDQDVMGGVPTKQRYSKLFQVPKKAMIHNWIAEHRCIWKEAKVKACLLPAIAEV